MNGSLQVLMSAIVDKEEEKRKLLAEQEKLNKEIARAEGMLSNQNFVAKAPAAKIQAEKEKLEKFKVQLQIVEERLQQLN